MASQRLCFIHYHELGLKGRNRLAFERALMDNIDRNLAGYQVDKVRRISGHLVVDIDDGDDIQAVAAAIAATPGVAKVSLAWRCDRDIQEMGRTACLALAECEPYQTFKASCRRSNTDFPIDSMELNQLMGEALCAFAPNKQVKMKDPDVTVNVWVIQGSAYIFARALQGVGGLPVGTGGRVVTLLSAGIDSPVATWRIVKRGAVAICVHFSGRPQTSDSSEYLVRDIIDALAPAGGIARLYVIPFGDYQRAIAARCPGKLRVIMYRRLMFAVAQRIASIEEAKALVTGESLGQVASQTLDNIWATDDAVDMPVLRPLIGSDKQEIIREAKALGTYEISIQNQSDCCTLFMPRNPETHADLREVREAWSQLPTDEWIESIVQDAEITVFDCLGYRMRH
ncbi:MAG: tRNA 4-thiouridine(8) synthase ThiI [Coriobacteriales bacterium]|nr:tRNA 4-thiouridine(8) synthase ThiI [Coriobacteriales bacterium]MBQ6586467.1 tRNA 4-thiouridine(8) synthase ThiI [Coriobacteriales bacterium]